RLHSIRFRVKDNTEEIPSFEAYLDGQWLRFSNDKAKDYIYTFDEKCPPGKHLLRVVVKDLAGNTTEKSYQFTR
ncbi:MAG: M23 family peptidase, partial [Bacteroidetes bacterium]|nr:M23 family peptidase [Bacteroidota bacterium]